jgi:hypothetical protein
MSSSPPSSTQEYCLKWNNHQTTIINVMDTLLEEESLVDVTLSADGQLIRAHRIILSACSPYFRSLFKSTYMLDKHPIIVLNGVDFENLKSLIEYMYKGEANVPQHMLSSFIQTAETLQVRGLAEGASKQKLEQVAEMHSAPPPLNIPNIPPPLNSFKQENISRKKHNMVDSISGGILAARLANMVDAPVAAMPGMFDLHEHLAYAARQHSAHNPPPIKRKKVNSQSPMKGDAKSEGLSVKKDLLLKSSKVTPKSQNIMSSGNSMLAAPNNNYESDSDVLKIDEDPENIKNGDKNKDDDIADLEAKENGIDSEEEAMSNKELAERAVPAIGFINPWTGEDLADEEDSITDGVGPAFPSLDNSLSSLSRLDISGDKSGGSLLITSTPGQDGKDPVTNKYSCQRCGRAYLHQATLVRHQRYECGITASYPCRLCGRKFKRRDVLKGHMEKCMNKTTAALTTSSPLVTSSSPLRGSSSPLMMTSSSVPSMPSISPYPGLMH